MPWLGPGLVIGALLALFSLRGNGTKSIEIERNRVKRSFRKPALEAFRELPHHHRNLEL
jgi:hypothetical protein